jgi:hypothetical protein
MRGTASLTDSSECFIYGYHSFAGLFECPHLAILALVELRRCFHRCWSGHSRRWKRGCHGLLPPRVVASDYLPGMRARKPASPRSTACCGNETRGPGVPKCTPTTLLAAPLHHPPALTSGWRGSRCWRRSQPSVPGADSVTRKRQPSAAAVPPSRQMKTLRWRHHRPAVPQAAAKEVEEEGEPAYGAPACPACG